MKYLPGFIACVLATAGTPVPVRAATPTRVLWGNAAGVPVDLYTLNNAHGLEARVATYGATLVSLLTPDRNGSRKNIVLGFDSLEPYLAGVPYYGATVGRYANRIANARFTLDGKTYHLAANNGPNSLHGGLRGFDKRVWKAEARADNSVQLTYVSAAGEEGYPGQLTAHVTYTLRDDDSLEIALRATTTAATPVNLVNHTYFNLTGNPTVQVLDHVVTINADRFTPVNANLIPTGELRPVAGTPFDFRQPHRVGERIGADDEQLKLANGYDHNWVINASGAESGSGSGSGSDPGSESSLVSESGSLSGSGSGSGSASGSGSGSGSRSRKPVLAARVSEPTSGRSVEVWTTQPGVQFYTGNSMDGKPAGNGSVYAFRTGLCLETQHFPDSPNHRQFPSTILRPGQVYRENTILKLAAK